jgi:hypothetical protein
MSESQCQNHNDGDPFDTPSTVDHLVGEKPSPTIIIMYETYSLEIGHKLLKDFNATLLEVASGKGASAIVL